jgi:hypothetical protein
MLLSLSPSLQVCVYGETFFAFTLFFSLEFFLASSLFNHIPLLFAVIVHSFPSFIAVLSSFLRGPFASLSRACKNGFSDFSTTLNTQREQLSLSRFIFGIIFSVNFMNMRQRFMFYVFTGSARLRSAVQLPKRSRKKKDIELQAVQVGKRERERN